MNHHLDLQTESCLYNVKKPYQYIGNEYLSFNKEWDSSSVRIALAFPDKYEIAISNLGQRILYHNVNIKDELLADRVYAPDFDFREILKSNKKLLYTLEQKRSLKEFDFVGFSMQYELCYPTMLEMLALSDIPLERTARGEQDPLIIAGGPCAYNPAPMSDFIDLFMIGEGEELIVEMMESYKLLKAENKKREDIIYELAKLEGMYSPALNNKTVKRIVQFKNETYPTINPIPYSSSVHDRVIVEIRRGCGRMCRFCQAGHTSLPVRERKAEDIIKLVKESVKNTGYDEYSLLSLSSNDYTNIEEVIEELSQDLNAKKVSASLPSQRIDKYSAKLANLVQGVRKSTVTLAPEAGSQRMRNVINKNLTEEQIIDTILTCYRNGFSSVKLYFILGLPTETLEDIDEMAQLLSTIKYRANMLKKELALKDSIKMTCTVSIFVPKPFTPFQWHPQNNEEQIREKINYLLDKTKPIKGVKINYHTGFVSKIEAAFARGNKSFGKYIKKLHESGAYMTTWDENIDFDLWRKKAEECGISLEESAEKQFTVDEELPWNIIDCGIDKEWFVNEYNMALASENTIPCEFRCVNCGVCRNLKTKKNIDEPYMPELKQAESIENKEVFRYRIQVSKENELRYLSHLDWQNTIIKTLFRSGLNLVFSQGFNPTPKISLGIALPIFLESRCELIDIEIYDNLEPQVLKNCLNSVLPDNIKISRIVKIPKDTKAIDILAQWALYEFEPLKQGILNSQDLLYIINKISSSDEIFIEKKNKKGIKKLVNIKPSIKSAEFTNDKIQMILKTGQNNDLPSIKADDVIKLYYPEVEFKITRLKFLDENLTEL